MDVHRPRKIRCPRVIEPVIISEPRVFGRDGNQIARPQMLNARRDFLGLSKNFFYTGISSKTSRTEFSSEASLR